MVYYLRMNLRTTVHWVIWDWVRTTVHGVIWDVAFPVVQIEVELFAHVVFGDEVRCDDILYAQR